MNADTFYGLREMLLPGPSQTTGYRTVLVVGTTGAGKTTLIRQILGTDPDTEAFPATSAFKTTVAETELLMAPGDYYGVVTFLSETDVREAIHENVVAAGLALFDDRSPEEVRKRLLEHADQRFRLSYVLSPGTAPIGEDDNHVEADPIHERIRADTEAVLDQITVLVEEAVLNELDELTAEQVDLGALAIDELHSRLKERLATHPVVAEIVNFLIDQVKVRFDLISPHELSVGQDGWPMYWQTQHTDRGEFLRSLQRFTSNDARLFGTLLTPIVSGVRVRGPFTPTWSPEIPYLMLIDREGLGHTPDSATSLPSATTRMFDEVDTIMLVDNAQQPMLAAPAAAIREIAAAGHGNKLIVAFSHFEHVQGANLPDVGARRQHVVGALDQVLTAVGGELGYSAERMLRHRLDRNCYFLSRMQGTLSEEPDARTLSELRWMLATMRVEAAPVDLGASLPIYDRVTLGRVIEESIANYLIRWQAKLGLQPNPMVSTVHWSKIRALCDRLARRSSDEYDALRPAGDLLSSLAEGLRIWIAAPVGWTDEQPFEDHEPQIFDYLSQQTHQRLRPRITDRLGSESADLWGEARDLSGEHSSEKRADFVYHKILEQQVPASGGATVGDHACFVDAVIADTVEALSAIGVTVR